ncbi:MAG: GIY-YIG nuclease family protein [Jaaginema sp. PMC 1079.18]|nr:GIY-YIG nuclease family protein [Jaaginema sp. PMC 1080.18]MEC4854178.1 GIY-YIG nuclease family protein [Jaaginema sp. PMC 1079.18]
MPTSTDFSTLADLEFTPYLDNNGQIPDLWDGKIGVYGIFDRDRVLQLVNYSRNISASLKQHLVRQPQQCYWLKVQTITRPSRTLLQDIQTAWIAENQTTPPGNDGDRALWLDPIDAKLTMTEGDRQAYAQSDDLGKSKLLKNIARRYEAEILAQLKQRGSTVEIRFNPKLKEQGLLDLK